MATDSHLRFALAVHAALGAEGGNSCFSPYSVASALTLAARAARGRTREELVALLGDPDEQTTLLRDAARPAEEVRGEQPELAVANTLWADDRLPLEDSFKAELAGWPGAAIASAPFHDEPEAARALINDDVGRTTRGLIPRLLPPGSIDEAVAAVLVNALYLKAAWKLPFREANTSDAPFHAPSGTRDVPTMWLSESVGYAHDGGWQAVQLVAAGGLQTLVLLPDGDLAEAEAALDQAALTSLLGGIRSKPVELALPKVSLDVPSSLTGVLRGLGVRTMFTDDADLSGLSPDPRLTVSEVLHQAVLRVDEQGFEGAAATAVTMRLTSMIIDEPVAVTVDRPFLLLVRHAGTGALYFLARVVEP
ncbi:serpin family protein [Amycolatopsis vastitatis]|uniref:Serpin family protein n=1 Tax=Amycolatopsis vastitatis TaxID=1905142 RepID=A0A229SVP3_9PSEU|nr:serpin family protein [Amycolatopsis vastitatis]OXM62912.1 serpin family protein [Amycolatopsis vastitatis]